MTGQISERGTNRSADTKLNRRHHEIVDMTDYENTPKGKRTAQKYADIINLKRPASKRPKMDLTHRAKIFSPYDALRGFDEAIDDTAAQSGRVQKILLSEEETATLSDKLLQVKKGMHLEAEYFVADPDGMGNYRTAVGKVLRIDPTERVLQIEETAPDTTGGKIEKVLPTIIKFDDLLDVKSPEIKNIDDFLGI